MPLFNLLACGKRPSFAFGLELFKPGPILSAVEFFVGGRALQRGLLLLNAVRKFKVCCFLGFFRDSREIIRTLRISMNRLEFVCNNATFRPVCAAAVRGTAAPRSPSVFS